MTAMTNIQTAGISTPSTAASPPDASASYLAEVAAWALRSAEGDPWRLNEPVRINSPRRYNIGDTIPEHGRVIHMSLTAYVVWVEYEGTHVVPFYGPNGVDQVEPVSPLVVLR